MKNVIKFPNKNVNPAMAQAQLTEVRKRVDSGMSLMIQKAKQLEERIFVLEHTIKDAFLKSEAVVDALTKAGLIDQKSLSESVTKIRKQMDDAEEVIADQIYGLETLDTPAENGNIARIIYDICAEDGQKLEEQRTLEVLIGGEENYQLMQMKEIAKELKGKKSGDKSTINITIPAEEKDNSYAGKTVVFNYEVLKVKALKNGTPKPTPIIK